MRYQLIENYFQSKLFQDAVQNFFDTVFGKIITENTTLSAKGEFVQNSKVIRDYYDMPYHIHILNGLIPALFVYEKYLEKQGWIDDPALDLYLRIFILGFTFHDANKLFPVKIVKGRSELESALLELDKIAAKWSVKDFLNDYEKHKSTVHYLAIATEDRTAVSSGDYKISVDNWKHVSEVQRELCHLADALASIQNESLEDIESLYEAIKKSLLKISNIELMPISYIKIRQNPYTLLSRNLLQVARKVLYKSGKKVLYTTKEGFVYWGENITNEEFIKIQSEYLTGSEDDIKFLELTSIDAQKCKFGFIGSIPFTQEVLEEIMEEKADRLLSLSPNSNAKITNFNAFVDFTKKIIENYKVPIDYEIKDNKLLLRFVPDSDEYTDFKKVYSLHKIQWLNVNENKIWKDDLDAWINSDIELPYKFIVALDENEFEISSIQHLLQFINDNVNSTSALFKTYLNFVKTYHVIENEEDIENYIENLQISIISHFEKPKSNNIKQSLFEKYFEAKGNINLSFLKNYSPEVPTKKEMCAFTGGGGTIEYNSTVAFAMKARGFSNRTITSLNNTKSHISELFAEENKLRTSLFKVSDANLILYHDFFEANLDIDKEIIHSSVKAKNELKILKDGAIEFDKNLKFSYNLYNLDYVKVTPKVEPVFFLIRKCLRMTQELGLRTYISGIMSPYQPHKSVFHFDNAPIFVKQLGWDKIRLSRVDEAIDEMKLVLTFGKDRLETNLLKIALNRSAYFSLYYRLKKDERDKVYNSLIQFYKKYNHKFPNMTVIEKLVDLAVKIDIGFSSSAEETWLIRTALEYLRKYHKQKSSREDIIQKMCGEIFRKKRMDNPNMSAIKDFCTAIYDELFLKDWNGKILSINQEKDWIYQFAFLFREKSLEIIRTRKAKEIKEKLESQNKEINEENIKELLDEKTKRYANQYLETIKKL